MLQISLSQPAPFPVTRRSSLASSGFTLVEALVGTVIIAVAVSATFAVFSTAIRGIRLTEDQASQSSLIEADVSRIGNLSVSYNACTNSAGSLAACAGQAQGNSFYYFPGNTANVPAFYNACNATAAGSHITANFITAINGLAQPGPGVTRLAAARENGADPQNHVVVVQWQTPTANPARVIKITPVVSSWCP
jgi:type II secretory pathway pseudopilin PulG